MTWDFDGLQAEQPLAEIYNDIRETEPQAVGGRWRALTRAHAQKVALQEADLHATMVAHISDTLVLIIVTAGCTKSYEEAYRTFTQKFGERISNIVKMASRLNKAMGEEVTSADLWPTNAASGDKFDGSYPRQLRDTWGRPGREDHTMHDSTRSAEVRESGAGEPRRVQDYDALEAQGSA
ncbi:hypothetical protein HD554DRAFT_2167482 [Boletus coccyginus]|nr:hypothetical protein HD554DRAFT_2167482 [Boletus coccyginus]